MPILPSTHPPIHPSSQPTHSLIYPILPPTHSPNLPILPTNPFSHSQPLNAPVVDDSEEEEDGINLIVEDALHPSVDAKKSLQPDVIAPSNGAKERKKFPWVQDWGSPNGPMWWWCQGDPTIQWGEAQKKDMKAALFKALGAAKMTRSKSNFKGAHPFSQLLPTHPPTTHSPGHTHSPMSILPNNPFSHPTHPPIHPFFQPRVPPSMRLAGIVACPPVRCSQRQSLLGRSKVQRLPDNIFQRVRRGIGVCVAPL